FEAEDLAQFGLAMDKLLQKHAAIQQLRDLRDQAESGSFSAELWRAIGEQGLLPDANATAPLPLPIWAVSFASLGRHLAQTPLLDTLLAARLAALAGWAAIDEWHQTAAAGGRCLALVGLEPHQQVRAEAVDGGWVLQGTAVGVHNATEASHFVVCARTSGGGDGLFWVSADSVGLGAPRRLLDSNASADVTFNALRLDAMQCCVDSAVCEPAIAQTQQLARVLLAFQLQGVAEAALQRGLDWLTTREQFGVKIGSFQALQHRAGRAYLELEKLKALNIECLQQLTCEPEQLPRWAAACKFFACSASRLITGEAIQWHGGIGMTDECDIGFFYKFAATLGARFGGREQQLQQWLTQEAEYEL
ncbi:MAG: acyl-CoA dehydrogenase, partial [Halioglobus sp.]|nr:acyl-CoA dehydrogenase [Halioglobus sp.]